MSQNIQIRLSENDKREVETIFKALGLSTTQAIKLFLKQVQIQQGLPFEVKLRSFNVESIEAFQELESIEKGVIPSKELTFQELKDLHRTL